MHAAPITTLASLALLAAFWGGELCSAADLCCAHRRLYGRENKKATARRKARELTEMSQTTCFENADGGYCAAEQIAKTLTDSVAVCGER